MYVCIYQILALVAEQQVTPDVPIALVHLSSLNQSSLLSVSYSQLYAFSNWSISQGQSSNNYIPIMSIVIYSMHNLYMYTSAGTASQPPTVAMEPDPNICRFHSFLFFLCCSQSILSLPPSVPPLFLCLSFSLSPGLRSRLGDPLDQSASASAACFSSLPSCEVIFVCGFWDNSFKCFASNSGIMYGDGLY